MALRDENHPSSSAGRSATRAACSPAHHAAAAWLRACDPSRPVQYEGVLGEALIGELAAGVIPDMAELLAAPKPESDVVAPMYPAVDDLVALGHRGAARPGR